MTTASKKRFVRPSGWRRDRITNELITDRRRSKIEYRYNFTLEGQPFEDVIPKVRRLWKEGYDLAQALYEELSSLDQAQEIALDSFNLKLAARQIRLDRTPRSFRSFYEAALEHGMHPNNFLRDLQESVENAKGYVMVERLRDAYKELTASCYVIYFYAGATFQE